MLYVALLQFCWTMLTVQAYNDPADITCLTETLMTVYTGAENTLDLFLPLVYHKTLCIFTGRAWV